MQERTKLTPDDIKELLNHLCINTTYFRFNDVFYKQTKGVAMGSPVSATIANIYMEHLEDIALNTIQNTPKLYVRYVDDTFVITKRDQVE